MSKIRDETPGVHHVWCRGNNKRTIAEDDLDLFDLLGRMSRARKKRGWEIYAYCVMSNHYHVVLEIDERGMSGGLCELNTGYATEFNRRHGRINHLFGRRYGNRFLKSEEDVLNTIRYVVQNPVRAGVVERAEDYPWSSYRATVGAAFSPIPLALDKVLGGFSGDPIRARERFADFAGTAPRPPCPSPP